MQTRNANTQAAGVMLAAAFLSAGAFAQPRPAPPPPAPGGEFLHAVNETQGTVRLELFGATDAPGKDARARMMACLPPKGEAHWELGPGTANARVRMQVLQGDTCDEKQKVVCEQLVPRDPRVQHVALRSDGRSCGLAAMPAPKGLVKSAANPCGGPWVPLTIVNKDKTWALWATMYNMDKDFPKILYAACWMPGETRMACVERHNYYVRAEMVGRSNDRPAASCSELKRCDTLPDGKPAQHGRTGNAPLGQQASATLTMHDGGGCVFR